MHVRGVFTVLCLALAVLLAFGGTVWAGSGSQPAAAAPLPAAAEQTALLEPGNYCLGCHLSSEVEGVTPAVWNGTIEHAANLPCPAALQVQQEVYYTERALAAIASARTSLGGDFPESTETRLTAAEQSYSRLLDNQVTSLEAFRSEAQVLRYQLGKIYTSLLRTIDRVKLRNILIWAVVVTLAILASLAWGLHHTRKVGQGSRTGPGSRIYAIALLAIFVLFALPIFRLPEAEVTETTQAEMDRQAVLDEASRAAQAAERSQARAWMMARVGANWSDLDPEKAETAVSEALTAAREAERETAALWGYALAAQEATAGTAAKLDDASLIGQELAVTSGRAWGYRLMAAEWQPVDHKQAVQMLERALETAQAGSGAARDLDLRAIAAAWAGLDEERALKAASLIHDPALQAWALRSIAEAAGDPALYEQALEAARQIEDPLRKAYALAAVAKQAGLEDVFGEASAALDRVTGQRRAYALADLAAASGDESVVEQIDRGYPAARVLALYRLGNYPAAWLKSAEIGDLYERARAQASIAAAWENADQAMSIEIPALRDLALREITKKTGDVSLAQQIESIYYRAQALTAVGEYQAAWEIVDGLRGDTYPLVDLAVRWAEVDPEAALAVVEKMKTETEKAVALRAIAAATGDEEIFQRALGMALAARVRNDATSPVQASLDLAAAFPDQPEYARQALEQAFAAAQQISIK